jgi:hypothetical protein
LPPSFLHIRLLGDLRGAGDWTLALLVGGIGFWVNLAWALGIGLLLWWIPWSLKRLREAGAPA